MQVEQRRTCRQPPHDQVRPARGESGLVRRLVRRGEQRDLHQSERQHGREQRHRAGDRDQPSSARQQGDMNGQAAGTRGVAAAGQCAQFGGAEDAIGHHVHARTMSKYYAITPEEARRATASPGTPPPSATCVRHGGSTHRAASRCCRTPDPTPAATRSPCSGARISTSAPMKRAGGQAMPNWRASRFRQSVVMSGPSA